MPWWMIVLIFAVLTYLIRDRVIEDLIRWIFGIRVYQMDDDLIFTFSSETMYRYFIRRQCPDTVIEEMEQFFETENAVGKRLKIIVRDPGEDDKASCKMIYENRGQLDRFKQWKDLFDRQS